MYGPTTLGEFQHLELRSASLIFLPMPRVTYPLLLFPNPRTLKALCVPQCDAFSGVRQSPDSYTGRAGGNTAALQRRLEPTRSSPLQGTHQALQTFCHDGCKPPLPGQLRDEEDILRSMNLVRSVRSTYRDRGRGERRGWYRLIQEGKLSRRQESQSLPSCWI